MGKGDHIIIPKSILKKFISKNNKISVLDLCNNEFKEVYPDDVYVEKDYFDDDIDKYIKDTCETIIGKLNYELSNDKELKKFKKNNIRLMKNIFVIQYFRNPKHFRIKEEWIDLKIKKELENLYHNMNLQIVMEYLQRPSKIVKENKILKELDEYYNELTPSFIILSNTKRNFIIPSSHFIYIKNGDENMHILPISPNHALYWTDKNEIENVYKIINKDMYVEDINKYAILGLENENDRRIYGTYDEIKYIKDELSKNI